MSDISQIVDAINQMNQNIANKNTRQGAIIGANTDGTYTVLATTDKGEQINLYNRKSNDDSVNYAVDNALATTENINIQVLLLCPDGDINRSVINKLAQYNFPPNPTIKHFNTASSIEPPCFLAKTLIKTFQGEIEIEKIKSGMEVFGYNEKLNKIVNCKVNKLIIHNKEEEKVTEYYLLKTENSEVKVTKNHPFYTESGEYRQIQQITDYIYLFQDNSITREQIISKELIQTIPTITYNLSLDLSSPCNYFANNYLVHNSSNK